MGGEATKLAFGPRADIPPNPKRSTMIRNFLKKIDLTGKKQLEKTFAGREPLSAEDFYLRYFQERGFSRDLVIRVKKVFDANIGFDLSRLSAEDDFSKELNFIWDHDSLADVETVIGLEKEFGITISDDEAVRMKTIRDVVEVVDGKLNISG